MFMIFLNSLPIRITLALIGGILYGLLTYALILVLDLPIQAAIGIALFVFLLYLGSRLLILLSEIDTPYYSKKRKGSPYENTAFYQTAQWVGNFYHYHDIALFILLTLIAVAFLIFLVMDFTQNNPPGKTIRDLFHLLFPIP